MVESARNSDFTDVVMIHEHRGEPDGLVVCHMPYGPSAYFGIFNTVCLPVMCCLVPAPIFSFVASTMYSTHGLQLEVAHALPCETIIVHDVTPATVAAR